MRKLYALYINEMIKISKKISVIIMLAIIIIGVFGIGGLMKLDSNRTATANNNSSIKNIQFQKDKQKKKLDALKMRFSEIQKQKASITGMKLKKLESEEVTINNEINKYQYANDKDLILDSNGYRAQAIQKLFIYKLNFAQLVLIPASDLSNEQNNQIKKMENIISRIEKSIEKRDFKEYIAICNDEINSKRSMSNEEKQIYLESNRLKLKYNLTGEGNSNDYFNNNSSYYINQIEHDKLSLLNNYNNSRDNSNGAISMKPLSSDDRKKIKNDIAVNTYKVENGFYNNSRSSNRDIVLTVLLDFGTFMIIMLILILAGGSISQEVSTGSIKSLIISPTKRSEIFAAKVLSLISVMVISSLLLFTTAIIAKGIYFGFSGNLPYIYASDGTAYKLNFYVYQFARLFSGLIEVIVYMTFALMLSVLTKNTAASVGISVAVSVAVIFSGNVANQLLVKYLDKEWLKYVPFNNLDITSKLFPYDTINQTLSNLRGTVNNSLLFSLCYVVVLIVCMGYTTLDSFARRDIL